MQTLSVIFQNLDCSAGSLRFSNVSWDVPKGHQGKQETFARRVIQRLFESKRPGAITYVMAHVAHLKKRARARGRGIGFSVTDRPRI